MEMAIRQARLRGMCGAGEHCSSPERSEVELRSLTERIPRRQTGFEALTPQHAEASERKRFSRRV